MKTNFKKTIKQEPFTVLLTASVLAVAVLTFSNFTQWDGLAGLLYPTKTTDEISGTKSNRLEILAFMNDHQIDKEYDFEALNYNISQVSSSLTTPGIDGSGTTPYVIESNEDIKNIILEPSNKNNFVGWSGCDAETDFRCQVSATNHQKRKVEAHYSSPEPEPNSLQLFSVSNNPLEGSLTDEWTNANPALAYKAAYVKLTGSIPNTIGDLNPELQLNLGGNELTGSIPTEIGELSKVDYIGLQKNSLEGEMPKELEDISPKYLLANMNNLEGKIPEELGNMGSRIQRLELHDNNLEGEVPQKLTEIGALIPNELRLYKNSLESAESGFMKDAPWAGINFHQNNFSKNNILDSLGEAAQNSGDYIDFCKNSVVVEAKYSADGSSCNLDVPDEVNKAVENWGSIYVDIELLQSSEHFTGNCSGSCAGTTKTSDGETSCGAKSSCEPQTKTNTYNPLNYPGTYCLEITDPIYNCDDIDAVPNEVDHAAEYSGCDFWTHGECEPVCDSGGCRSGNPPSCSADDSGWHCKENGFGSGRDNLTNEGDSYEEGC